MRQTVRRAAAAGVVAMLLGAVTDANAAAILYVSNFENNTITSYDAATGATLGSVVIAGGEAAGFNGLRVTPSGGFLVAGQFTNNVVKYDSGGSVVNTFDPANAAGLSSAQGLTYGPDGNLYVASAANDKILIYDPVSGDFLGTSATLGVPAHDGPIDLVFGPDGNLYVTTFDSGRVIKVNGTTGAVLDSTNGPAGFGFGPAAFGPNGVLYIVGLDVNSFLGGVFQYDLTQNLISPFITSGTGGLDAPGGLAFDLAGNLLVSNLVFDPNTFADIGSSVLRFNGQTGAPMGTFVPPGQGLAIPFFMQVAQTPEAVPEPTTASLLAIGLGVGTLRRRRRARGGDATENSGCQTDTIPV